MFCIYVYKSEANSFDVLTYVTIIQRLLLLLFFF